MTGVRGAVRRRRGRRSDSRERVLRAAGRLFSRQGYAATSVDEIATQAQASPSSIYWHFRGGKDDILLAVLEETTTQHTETILHAVRQGATLAAKADIFLGAVEKQMRSGTETVRLIMQMALERADADPAVRARIRSIYRKFRAAIVDEMTAEFPGVEAKARAQAAAIQVGLFEGVFLQWQLDPDDVDLGGVFALLRGLFAGGAQRLGGGAAGASDSSAK
jgi:TetR/AcrR family transcriptional repressor of lmrAB and yxaGH operons